jgi:hypothetical protein
MYSLLLQSFSVLSMGRHLCWWKISPPAGEGVSFAQKSEFQLRTSLLDISIIEICSY